MRQEASTTYISARVPLELAQSFGRLAALRDRSISAELRQAMREHVAAGDEAAPRVCLAQDWIGRRRGETRDDYERRREREVEETAEVVDAFRRRGDVLERDGGRWKAMTGSHAGTTFDTARTVPSTRRLPAGNLVLRRVRPRPRGAGGRPAARRASGPRSGQDPGEPDDNADPEGAPSAFPKHGLWCRIAERRERLP